MLRYHGGKWRIGPTIIQLFPPHRVYVEPFGGGASILMRKAPSYAEVYNDLDHGVVTTFRVLRDPTMAAELERQLRLTPWSRHEFGETMVEPDDDPIELARRTVVRAFQGFGTTSRQSGATGWRGKPFRNNSTGVRDWCNYPDAIPDFTGRLRGVTIEERPALQVIQQYDDVDTFFYLDPPYPAETRTSVRWPCELGRAYRHNLTDDDHRALAMAARACRGMVMISGYHCSLYDQELYPDWPCVEIRALADGARRRTECVWMSPSAAALLPQPGLFALPLGADAGRCEC